MSSKLACENVCCLLRNQLSTGFGFAGNLYFQFAINAPVSTAKYQTEAEALLNFTFLEVAFHWKLLSAVFHTKFGLEWMKGWQTSIYHTGLANCLTAEKILYSPASCFNVVLPLDFNNSHRQKSD